MQTSLDKFSKRLQYLIDNKGLKNANKFAAHLGYKSPEKISRLLRGSDTKPSFDILLDIANKFEDVSIRWLLTGEGEMTNKQAGSKNVPSSTPQQSTSNLPKYRGNSLQEPVLEIKPIERTYIMSEDGVELIPLTSLKAAAGGGYFNETYIDSEEALHIPKRLLKPGKKWRQVVDVVGDSMAPTMQDGGFALITYRERGEWQDMEDERVFCIVDTEGSARLKRVKNRLKEHGLLILTSDNPDRATYPSITLKYENVAHIWDVEWYLTPKLPNIHDTYYTRLQRLEDRFDILYSKLTDRGLEPID